jgi:tetratricopeptide (TPR) repeat protein
LRHRCAATYDPPVIVRRATVIFAMLLPLRWTIPCAGASPQAAPATRPLIDEGSSPQVAKLIDALGDPDPLQRSKAEQALVAMGSAARSAVRVATRSDDPEIAGRARAVLQKMPWALPSDSPNARRLLAGYGVNEQQSQVVISNLVRTNEIGVLLRLLDEEPQAERRWQIATELSRVKNLELDRRLSDVAPEGDNAPLLFLAAAQAPRSERQRTVALCRRMIELESVASSPALDKLFLAYAQLIVDCMERDDYPAAAALLRQQVRTATPSSQDFHESLASLLALQAYFGPLPGYRSDVSAARGRPVLGDAFIGLYEMLGLPPPPQALAISAQLRAPMPLELRYFTAWFVHRRRMTDAARAEFTLFVNQYAVTEPAPERGAPAFWKYAEMAAQAHEQLARITGESDANDAAAAEHLRQAAAIRQRDDDGLGNAEINIRIPGLAAIAQARAAELHWRELRAARSVGDRRKLREHLDALKDTTPANTDIVLDVVPLLKETGQPAAARAMFDKTYARLREAVDADPEEPEPMNNLAWLCARSGERLDEALQMATRAITLDPDNAAYLDTAAEANFRVGNIDEAIRLETKGLEGRPDDKFMREQLERFNAAKKK